jgi:hypothetical protein
MNQMKKLYYNFINRSHLMVFLVAFLLFTANASAQQVSPLQTGHYSPAFSNVRDMARGAPGLAIVWYNHYAFTNTYVDRNGDEYSKIPLQKLEPDLPDVLLGVEMQTFATVPAIFYGMPFEVLGGAQWMIGVTPSYMWANSFVVAEGYDESSDSLFALSDKAKLSGFGDLSVVPLGLTWSWDHFDLTFYYGFTAPTGRYSTGGDDNIGLGFWTHSPQLFTYFYPKSDQSNAIMLGLTYELNGKIKGEDFNPGNRLSLEWGISQYFTERFEVGLMGGHNWQVTDDSGDDVIVDPSWHDRKSTITLNIGYWAWKDRLQLTAKYGYDFGMRQRFKTNYFMLNITFATNALTGKNRK